MLIEVHSNLKSARPRRAIMACLFLLAATCALASTMVWQRTGHRLADRIVPPHWSISFQPPRTFEKAWIGPTRLGSTYLFQGNTQRGAPVLLAVYRLEGKIPSDARRVCQEVLSSQAWLPLMISHAHGVARSDRRLGLRRAAEIWVVELGIVVRAIVLNKEEAYAVLLGVNGAAIDRPTYRLFDDTCGSFQFAGGT